jgi:hypothetical protein
MMNSKLKQFREIWMVDFEFSAPSGERPAPVCLVALELFSCRKLRFWQDELVAMKTAPYPMDQDVLFIAYYASAELGCHLSLGWPLPEKVLDLFAEFRRQTNGLTLPCGNGLLGALAWYGLNGIETVEKDNMRVLATRGGPWTLEEKRALLDYCESDVDALKSILEVMIQELDLPRALHRGRYMKAVAHMENIGVPIDTDTRNRLDIHWSDIQDELIREINPSYGVFEGRTFKVERFAEWLKNNNIPWPRLETGRLDLSDDTFKEMARSYPEVAPLRELRVTLSRMRLSDLSIGRDGRNRCLLSAYSSRTGRNQPSTSKFIFGPAVWLRSLIRPEPGFGIAYIDWSQQEFGIAAALSGDPQMIGAYQSGDPYLAFAKAVGAVPPDATKASHGPVREQFKACILAVQYGMGPVTLARQIGQPAAVARDLLQLHRKTYKRFWEWSDAAVDYAILNGILWTVFGWEVRVGENVNPRFLRNFSMQANGAEMLRLACCFAVERGVQICAPIHDAILVEAQLDILDEKIDIAREAMSEASEIVLDGFRLRTDVKIVKYPERYMDERGITMWETIQCILNRME